MSLATRVKRNFKLKKIDLTAQLGDEAEYEKRLKALQLRMLEIQQAYLGQSRRAIIVLEGPDAAGKGGTIKRMVEALDPRSLRVWAIGKPSAEEQGRHYLYRFWERLPEPGTIAVFDRSWYGRVLVERVDKLIDKDTWQRSYREITEFEQMLCADCVRIIKLYLQISPEEQIRRFRERIETPVKRWKIAADDIRYAAHWPAYQEAAQDMLTRTSSDCAPWWVVPADRKWFARVAAISTVVEGLSAGIDLKPAAIDPAIEEAVVALFGKKARTRFGLRKAD